MKKFIWKMRALYLLHKPKSRPPKKLIKALLNKKDEIHKQILNSSNNPQLYIHSYIAISDLLKINNYENTGKIGKRH